MNQMAILTVLPSQKENAKSIMDIAHDLGLETCTYRDRMRVERDISRGLNRLVKWRWVARDRRQREEGYRLWYSIYWKTDLAPSCLQERRD
jgi:hypothetical protein